MKDTDGRGGNMYIPNKEKFDTLIFNSYDGCYWYSVVYNGKIYNKFKIENDKAPKKIINLCIIHEDTDEITIEFLEYIKKKFKNIRTLIYSNNGDTVIVPIRL